MVKTTEVNATTIEDAFEQSKLNWQVSESEMFNAANGKAIEGLKCIYRADNNVQLGVVGKNYGVLSNSQAFSFFNVICEQHGARIIKTREYNGGAIINLEAEVPNKKFDVKVGDEIGMGYSLYNSFNGCQKTRIEYFCRRLVCKNGLISRSKEETMIELRHTSHIISNLETALKVWNFGEQWYKSFIENVRILNNKIVDKQMVEKFLEDLFGESDSSVTRRKKDQVKNLFESGMGNNGKTAFDLVNGLVEYVDHNSRKDEEDRLEYSNLGQGYDLKAKAFELALNI